jgi:hypothetical protein
MKYLGFLLVGLCVVMSLVSCEQKEEVPKAADVTPMAKDFVEMLIQGDYTAAVTKFDATMKEAMPADKLQEAWNSLITQVGPFKQQTGVRQAKEQGYDVVFVMCEFEKAALDIKVVYNSYKQISGLWFVPSQ